MLLLLLLVHCTGLPQADRTRVQGTNGEGKEQSNDTSINVIMFRESELDIATILAAQNGEGFCVSHDNLQDSERQCLFFP